MKGPSNASAVGMIHRFEVFSEGSQVGVCLGESRSEGFVGLGIDFPAALEDLARAFRSEPRSLETPVQARLRMELPAAATHPAPVTHKFTVHPVSSDETWLPLTHSPEGALEENFARPREIGGPDMETLFYVQSEGDNRTTFKRVRYSPTREKWFQLVRTGETGLTQ